MYFILIFGVLLVTVFAVPLFSVACVTEMGKQRKLSVDEGPDTFDVLISLAPCECSYFFISSSLFNSLLFMLSQNDRLLEQPESEVNTHFSLIKHSRTPNYAHFGKLKTMMQMQNK